MLEKWDSIVMGKKYSLSYVDKMLSLGVNFVEMVWFILGAKYNSLKCHCMGQRAKMPYWCHHFVISDKRCYHHACHQIASCYNISLLMKILLLLLLLFFFNVYSIK